VQRFSRCAFSLVEVVVAMAIMSFASLVILSLIPVGAGALQTAQVSNMETEIFDQIKNEVQSSPYSTLFDSQGNAQSYISNFKRYYDLGGQDVTGTANPWVYSATLQKSPSTATVNGTQLSTTDNTGTSAQIGQTIEVTLVFHTTTNIISLFVVNKGY
jgi:uncharacterized protein (TIGR02598 family)